MEIRMKYAESVFLLFFGAVSILFLVLSSAYNEIAKAVPRICSVFVLCCAAFRLLQIWRGDSLKSKVLKVQKRALVFVFLLVGYTVGVYLAGLMLASALFIPLCMYWMGHRKLWLVFLITSGYLLFVYFVFIVGFRMPLPDSLIGF